MCKDKETETKVGMQHPCENAAPHIDIVSKPEKCIVEGNRNKIDNLITDVAVCNLLKLIVPQEMHGMFAVASDAIDYFRMLVGQNGLSIRVV